MQRTILWKGCSYNNRETPHWNISFSVFILNVYQYNFKIKQHNVTGSNMIWKSISVFLVSVITFRFFSPSSGKKDYREKSVLISLKEASRSLFLPSLSRTKIRCCRSLPGRGGTSMSEGNPERFASKQPQEYLLWSVFTEQEAICPMLGGGKKHTESREE